jgi:hypothetical protein
VEVECQLLPVGLISPPFPFLFSILFSLLDPAARKHNIQSYGPRASGERVGELRRSEREGDGVPFHRGSLARPPVSYSWPATSMSREGAATASASSTKGAAAATASSRGSGGR